MQEQNKDLTYNEPQPLTQKNLKDALKRIDNGTTKRLLIFAQKDAHGRPTKEMRRAWRRYNRKSHD